MYSTNRLNAGDPRNRPINGSGGSIGPGFGGNQANFSTPHHYGNPTYERAPIAPQISSQRSNEWIRTDAYAMPAAPHHSGSRGQWKSNSGAKQHGTYLPHSGSYDSYTSIPDPYTVRINSIDSLSRGYSQSFDNNNTYRNYSQEILSRNSSFEINRTSSADGEMYDSMVSPKGGPSQTTVTGGGYPPMYQRHGIANASSDSYAGVSNSGGGNGSNAQGRSLNKMLLEILRERVVHPGRLAAALDANIERFDCVNLATLLFHTGKKRLILIPAFVERIALRLSDLKEELRAREASNALYGLRCMSSDCPEVRHLVLALANKLSNTKSILVAQAVGNAVYGLQTMTSEHEEVRTLLAVLATKVSQCVELLEAQNVGNALYGMRGMNSDYKEVRDLIDALVPKIATVREDLNGQAVGNSIYGLQSMSSKEPEIRKLLVVLSGLVRKSWEDLKAQEVGNSLYGLKRMSSDVSEVRMLIAALTVKIAKSPDLLDAQAIGNSLYGLQNMKSDNTEVLNLLEVMAGKIVTSPSELDGQSMGNSIYGLQGMSSHCAPVRAVVMALTQKIMRSSVGLNAQELGNALYGMQNMTSDHMEVRKLMTALLRKVEASRYELTSQEIGNALFGLQGMSSDVLETRELIHALAQKISMSKAVMDPQGVGNALFGLQRMSCDHVEVVGLVEVLVAKVQASWKTMTAQQISNAFYGLQRMNSACPPVRHLLRALCSKLSGCTDIFSARQVVHILYGLQCMSSEQEEVLEILEIVAHRIDVVGMMLTSMQGNGALSPGAAMTTGGRSAAEYVLSFPLLCNAVYGMQGMHSLDGCSLSSDGQNVDQQGLCSAVDRVVHGLIKLYMLGVTNGLVDPSAEKLSMVELEQLRVLFFGLQRMNTSSEPVCALITLVHDKFKAILNRSSSSPEAVTTIPGSFDIASPSCTSFTELFDETVTDEDLDPLQSIVVGDALFGLQQCDASACAALLPFLSMYVLLLNKFIFQFKTLVEQFHELEQQLLVQESTDNQAELSVSSLRKFAASCYLNMMQLFEHAMLWMHSLGGNGPHMLVDQYQQALHSLQILLEQNYNAFYGVVYPPTEQEQVVCLVCNDILKRLHDAGALSLPIALHSEGMGSSVSLGFQVSHSNLLYGLHSNVLVVFQERATHSPPADDSQAKMVESIANLMLEEDEGQRAVAEPMEPKPVSVRRLVLDIEVHNYASLFVPYRKLLAQRRAEYLERAKGVHVTHLPILGDAVSYESIMFSIVNSWDNVFGGVLMPVNPAILQPLIAWGVQEPLPTYAGKVAGYHGKEQRGGNKTAYGHGEDLIYTSNSVEGRSYSRPGAGALPPWSPNGPPVGSRVAHVPSRGTPVSAGVPYGGSHAEPQRSRSRYQSSRSYSKDEDRRGSTTLEEDNLFTIVLPDTRIPEDEIPFVASTKWSSSRQDRGVVYEQAPGLPSPSSFPMRSASFGISSAHGEPYYHEHEAIAMPAAGYPPLEMRDSNSSKTDVMPLGFDVTTFLQDGSSLNSGLTTGRMRDPHEYSHDEDGQQSYGLASMGSGRITQAFVHPVPPALLEHPQLNRGISSNTRKGPDPLAPIDEREPFRADSPSARFHTISRMSSLTEDTADSKSSLNMITGNAQDHRDSFGAFSGSAFHHDMNPGYPGSKLPPGYVPNVTVSGLAPSTSSSGLGEEEQIALLENQIEMHRLQAQLLQLKAKQRQAPIPGTTLMTFNSRDALDGSSPALDPMAAMYMGGGSGNALPRPGTGAGPPGFAPNNSYYKGTGLA